VLATNAFGRLSFCFIEFHIFAANLLIDKKFLHSIHSKKAGKGTFATNFQGVAINPLLLNLKR